MATHVYWIDEQNSSRQNGIGTYRDVLLPKLASVPGIHVSLISLNSSGINLEIKYRELFREYSVPYIANGNWRENGTLILSVLKQYIPDSAENLFMMNHSPCSEFIRVLRYLFPKSQISFTIHDQGWCSTLLGDSNLLHQIIVEGICPEGFSTDKATYVHHQVKLDLELYNLVDKIVCLSPSTRRVLIDTYGVTPNKISMIQNGLGREISTCKYAKTETRQNLGLRIDDKILIFVGRPAYYKGIVPLLLALKKVRHNCPNLRCVFTGSITGFSKFEKYATDVAANLIFIGHVNHAELHKWYSAADVGVITSYSEQCSYSALEMMANGLPIVASDGNGVRDVFSDKNAIIAPIESIFLAEPYANNLATAIDKALSLTSAEISQLAKVNRNLLDTRYSAMTMASKYADLILSLGGAPIEEGCDDGIDGVGNPHSHSRRCQPVDGK